MADISEYLDNNITISAIEQAVFEAHDKGKRKYLGMSQIGEECWRSLWYSFRNCSKSNLTPASVMAIQDGYRQEDLTAERLRLLPYIELITKINGEQIGYKYIGGHFSGHCDGHIKGILEAPKTWHIWEHKSVNEKKFNELKNLILEVGEKNALEKWDYTYWCQAQIYMHAAGFTRHYLTVSTPGGRALQSCRTEINKKQPIILLEKANSIITLEKPPEKMNKSREYYKCRWCNHKDVCHDNLVPEVNCRTCAFSEPIIDTNDNEQWKCYKHNRYCDIESCDSHLFLNTLIPYKAIASDESKSTPDWIKYDVNGVTVYNVNKQAKTIPKSINLISIDMRKLDYFECLIPIEKIKSDIDIKKKEDKETTKKIKGLI